MTMRNCAVVNLATSPFGNGASAAWSRMVLLRVHSVESACVDRCCTFASACVVSVLFIGTDDSTHRANGD